MAKTYPPRRQQIPDPRCSHRARERRVSHPTPGTASVIVCARSECVEDAKDWVLTLIGEPASVFDCTTGAQVEP